MFTGDRAASGDHVSEKIIQRLLHLFANLLFVRVCNHDIDVDIAVTGVNDVFVFDAWKKSTGAGTKIEFLSDGNAEFAKALDLSLDASGAGLGIRSKRYAMLLEDGVIKQLNVEDAPGKAEMSIVPSRTPER